MIKHTIQAAAIALAAIASGSASAGNIYLSGHDIDFHDNQAGYDTVVLNYLRDTTAAASYRVGVVTGASDLYNIGQGFGTRTVRDISSFADAAAFGSFLSSVDVLIVSSEESCGGCIFRPADVVKLNSFRPAVTSFFNAGGDIFGLTGADNADYYGFLPPTAVATGTSISGSSGFTATAAGTAIGIQTNMINGFLTHNRFASFDPAFTVFETRPITGGAADEIISIGLRDGTIGGGGVIVITPTNPIPEPETYALMLAGLGLVVAIGRRRKTLR